MASAVMALSESFPIGPYFEPEKVSLEEYIDRLYQIFLSELTSPSLSWKGDGLDVSLRRHPEVDGRHAVFWHLISGGSGSELSREIQFERCVRLRWIRILVEIFNEEFPDEKAIRWWIDKKRSSCLRYVIARPDFDYIVVIEERQKFALLVTAFYIEHRHRRKKLEREHDAFWEKQKPPTG